MGRYDSGGALRSDLVPIIKLFLSFGTNFSVTGTPDR